MNFKTYSFSPSFASVVVLYLSKHEQGRVLACTAP